MRKLVGTLIILLVCLQASGEEPPCTRRFTVAVNNYAPQFYRDHLNRPQGLAHDLIENLQQRMGCMFIEKDISRPVAVEQMKTARLDLAFLILRNREFDKFANFEPLYRTKRELLVQKSVLKQGKSVKDFFNNKKIIYGSYIGSRIALTAAEEKDLFRSGRLVESINLPGLYESFKRNKVQAMMMVPLTNAHYVKTLNMEDQAVRIVDNDSSIEIGVYYSKRRITNLEKAKIRQALESMKNDGTLLRLLSEYMPKEPEFVVTYNSR